MASTPNTLNTLLDLLALSTPDIAAALKIQMDKQGLTFLQAQAPPPPVFNVINNLPLYIIGGAPPNPPSPSIFFIANSLSLYTLGQNQSLPSPTPIVSQVVPKFLVPFVTAGVISTYLAQGDTHNYDGAGITFIVKILDQNKNVVFTDSPTNWPGHITAPPLPSGWYTISCQILDSPIPASAVDTPYLVGTAAIGNVPNCGNNPGGVNGGMSGMADTLTWTGSIPLNSLKPYPFVFSLPTQANNGTTNLLAEENWMEEPLTMTPHSFGAAVPTLSPSGTPYDRFEDFAVWAENAGREMLKRPRLLGGERNSNSLSAYATYVRCNVLENAYMAIDCAGRLYCLDNNGEVYERLPAGTTLFNTPTDLCFKPGDNTTLYVADSANNRIAILDITNINQPFIKGQIGIGGGGPARALRMDRPTPPDSTIHTRYVP